MKIDKSIIKELSDYLDEFNLTEIEITEKDTKIKVSKNNVSISNQPVATSANAQNNVSEKPSVKSGTEITSPIIELHISNIYKREEFRKKSLISEVVNGGIFGLGTEGYILAIISLEKMLKNEN